MMVCERLRRRRGRIGLIVASEERDPDGVFHVTWNYIKQSRTTEACMFTNGIEWGVTPRYTIIMA